jgi:DNA-binding response OmpR family regulator
VVLDMMLPGYGGLEVLRRIRQLYPRITVLLSAARDSEEDRAAVIAAGADATWSSHTPSSSSNDGCADWSGGA